MTNPSYFEFQTKHYKRPPPEQEAGLVGVPRFVCPLPAIVVTHKLTPPTGRSNLRRAMRLRMIETYTAYG